MLFLEGEITVFLMFLGNITHVILFTYSNSYVH